MSTKIQGCFFCSLIVILGTLIGCGDSADSSASSQGGPSAKTAQVGLEGSTHPSQEARQPSHRLCGVWLGMGQLDVETFNQKIGTVADPQAQQFLFAQAQSIQSMILGVEYWDDGTFQVDMEMKGINNAQERQQSMGQWKVISDDGESVTVRTIETLEDGSQSVAARTYRFIDDKHFVMTLDSQSLADCNPMIVFELQETDEVDGNTADAQQTLQR